MLKIFASAGGYISKKTMGVYAEGRDNKRLNIPSLTKRLNARLRNLFQIKESIFAGTYRKNHGYKTKINFFDHRNMTPLR